MESNLYPIKIYSHDYDNTIKLDVFCIDKCNYTCEYCFNLKGGYKRTNKEIDLNKVIEFSKWLNLKTGKNILISLIGGEPTLHSQFIEFSKKTNELKNIINVVAFTNFSQTNDFFNTTINNNVKYLITFHYLNEYRTKMFFDKLQVIDNNNQIDSIDTINIMLLKDNFDRCLEIYDILFNKYGQKVRCNLIDDCNKENIKQLRIQNYAYQQLFEYSLRCKQSLQDKDNIVVYNNNVNVEYTDYEIKNSIDFNFKYWKCNAGKDYFNIDINENIFPCNDMKIKKLATLDTFNCIKFNPIICLTAACPCEYGLPKERIFKK